MKKRKAIQLLMEFVVDFSSLLLANAVSFVFCCIIHKIPDVTVSSFFVYLILLTLSFCVIFFGFSVSMDLSIRNRTRDKQIYIKAVAYTRIFKIRYGQPNGCHNRERKSGRTY